ncbi:hypothetical protein CO661_14220 [Sinorhizobium fredii]|uniref:Uncharacterized protein n=1 Tax=Rhizobium fredii TaxID=380 RepID=A0A2A6LXQ6_RHIFR|nr:hypothetical protein [Sinorhizobium fredii]PDT47334.1 hypothetical protein CO661_14220 [Sinorhizobium fredii]
MPTLNIQGRRVKVDDAFLQMSPEEQSAAVEEIAASLGVQAEAPESAASQDARNELSSLTQKAANRGDTAGRDVDSFMRGAADMASFGLADEIAAAGGALTGIDGDFGEYGRNLRVQRIIQNQRDQADPIASTAGRVAGGVATAAGAARAGLSPLARLPAKSGLGARIAAGAKEGAAYGGLYGFGSGEGALDRATDAVGGAAMGGAIGGAVPVVAQGVKSVTKPVTDAVKARVNPGQYASEKIAERLAASNMTADQAAARMGRDGLSLADVGGKSTQSLLRTTTNIPGKAQDRVGSQLTLRQMGQGDRLKAVVGQTLADPDGYLAAKDDIAQTAQRLAKPLYDEAYSTPVHFSESLEEILKTPAGQEALRRAEVLAANEQIPFQQLFINVADDGASATVRRVPDARGWDYIKRAMDDMIDSGKDSITGKLSNEARIINNLKDKMLSEIDSVNPAYKAARQAWSGQKSLDDALEFGRDAMRQSPEAVRRQIAKMGPAEKEAARAGAAEWIRNAIDQRNFTQNAILKFFSNRQQVKNLRALFDNDVQFKTFRQAIFAEARKRSTYETVKGNSTTVRQMADMAETGGLKEGADFVGGVVSGRPISATLQWVGSRLRMLGGLTPEVADNIAQRLMTSRPDAVRQIANELAKIEKAQITSAQRSNAIQALVSRALAAPSVAAISGN